MCPFQMMQQERPHNGTVWQLIADTDVPASLLCASFLSTFCPLKGIPFPQWTNQAAFSLRGLRPAACSLGEAFSRPFVTDNVCVLGHTCFQTRVTVRLWAHALAPRLTLPCFSLSCCIPLCSGESLCQLQDLKQIKHSKKISLESFDIKIGAQ